MDFFFDSRNRARHDFNFLPGYLIRPRFDLEVARAYICDKSPLRFCHKPLVGINKIESEDVFWMKSWVNPTEDVSSQNS